MNNRSHQCKTLFLIGLWGNCPYIHWKFNLEAPERVCSHSESQPDRDIRWTTALPALSGTHSHSPTSSHTTIRTQLGIDMLDAACLEVEWLKPFSFDTDSDIKCHCMLENWIWKFENLCNKYGFSNAKRHVQGILINNTDIFDID